jgi:hypothetical protein
MSTQTERIEARTTRTTVELAIKMGKVYGA